MEQAVIHLRPLLKTGSEVNFEKITGRHAKQNFSVFIF